MLENKIEAIPVVNEDTQVVGILNWDQVFAGKVAKYREPLKVPVVIMAGGKGTRLDPFTQILPKSLIPVGEKPIIEVIMDKFLEYDVKDFFICLYHKARMIKSYFEESNGKYNITCVEEKIPLGTIGPLSLLRDRLKGDFFVINCDVILNNDYAEILNFHRQKKYALTMVVSCRHYQIPYGICELWQGGELKAIKEKPGYDFLVNTGMYLMQEQVLDLIPDNEYFNIIQLVEKLRDKGLKIGVFPVSETSWMDVGQWEEYYKSIAHMKLIK